MKTVFVILFWITLLISACSTGTPTGTNPKPLGVIRTAISETQTAEATKEPPIQSTQLSPTETTPDSNPTKVTSTESIATAEDLEPTNSTPPSSEENSSWLVLLSRILIDNEAEDYLSPYNLRGKYSFGVEDGWQLVVAELWVQYLGSRFVQISDCPFRATFFDTGGYERPAKVGIGYSECWVRTSFPPGARMKVIAYTVIPSNQQPDNLVFEFDKHGGIFPEAPISLAINSAEEMDFSEPYTYFPDLPAEVSFMIPEKAQVTINFGESYFLDSNPDENYYSDSSEYSVLHVPTRVDNIGGYNIDTTDDIPWGYYIRPFGFDSQGNVSQGSNILPLKNDFIESIPPGRTAEFEIVITYWPVATTDVDWIWLGFVIGYGGEDTPYQLIAKPPRASGYFSPRWPMNIEEIEWFDQSLPSHQP